MDKLSQSRLSQIVENLEKTIKVQDEMIELYKKRVENLESTIKTQEEVNALQKEMLEGKDKYIELLERQLLIQDKAILKG